MSLALDTWFFVAASAAALWRLIDGGGSGLVPLRWVGVAATVVALLLGFRTGPLVAVGTSAALIGIWLVLFSATPDWLRRANGLRARSVREAVANSRTLWDSFSYTPQDHEQKGPGI